MTPPTSSTSDSDLCSIAMTTHEPPALGGPISAGQDVAQQQQGMSAIAGQGNGVDDPDVWIAQLMQCKPLSEGEVKRLCDKVSRGAQRRRRAKREAARATRTSRLSNDDGDLSSCEARDPSSEASMPAPSARISRARALSRRVSARRGCVARGCAVGDEFPRPS